MADYDAFLLVSFGGPEAPGDVMPFLRTVTRGRGIPDERLAAVAEHYYAVGGLSPINQQCRPRLEALRAEFPAAGLDLPIYWGNRNWDPYLTETVATMAAAGVRHAVSFVPSAYSSFSSCRQYLDDLDRARAEVGPGAPRIDKIRRFFNHPGFIEPFAEGVRAALEQLPAGARDRAPLVFTAHSVPEVMADASGPPHPPGLPGSGGRYVAELTEASRLIAERAPGAVIIPVGFVSDHMEVGHDLDTEAAEAARDLGLPLARAATPWYHPAFRDLVVDLVRERLEDRPDSERQGPGPLAPSPDECPAGCCVFARPGARPEARA